MSRIALSAIMTFLVVCPLPAIDKTLYLGGSKLWGGIATWNGVESRPGYGGFRDIVLKDSQYEPDENTDLLLHLDSNPPADATGSYAVTSSSIGISDRYAAIGRGSGVFQGQAEGLVVEPLLPSALFAPGNQWHDFTIEFWMYPAGGDDATVLLWRNFRRLGSGLLPQELRCGISGGRFVWSFTNLFAPPDLGPFSAVLQGSGPVIPRQWHHYMLRFSAETGLIESSVDGSPDAITYANPTGSENGVVYLPITGGAQSSRLVVGAGFTGFLDELRVSRSFVSDPVVRRFGLEPGSAITRIFDLGYPDTQLSSVESRSETPGNTGVFYYLKMANIKTSEIDLPGDWIQFAPGRSLPDAKGRYLQIKIELLPDGAGRRSPAVSSVSVSYAPHLPPEAPALLTARPGDGSITLSWRKVIDPDLAGYRVYYGDRPSQYFGADASAGPSPIDVGNATTVTVSGLSNGKLYYFAVVAYNTTNPVQLSDFSNEVAARPSKLLETPP